MTAQVWARIGGWASLAGGVLGAAAAIFLLAVPPVVPEDRFSFPFDAAGFAVIQIAFFVHHLVVALALWAFWRAGLAGRTRFAAVAAGVSVVAMLLLAVQELVAIAAAEEPLVSPMTDLINTGYGVITIALGIGLILLGIAAARARVLSAAGRWVVLISGIYVFVPLLPAIFAPFVFGRLALGVWLLLFAWLGIVMIRWAGATEAPQPVGTSRPAGARGMVEERR